MTEVAINLKYVADSQPSLCIPRVFNNITEERIRKVFADLDIGKISRIDIIERKGEKGDSFKRVYVHFEKWFCNADALTARTKLLSGKEIKIVYDNPWFWKVSANRMPNKSVSQRSKAHIDFDEDPMGQLVDQFGRSMEIRRDFEEEKQKRQEFSRYSNNRVTEDRREDRRPVREDRRPVREDRRSVREDRRPVREDRRSVREDRRSVREDRRPVREDRRPVREENNVSSRGYDSRAPENRQHVLEPITPPGSPPRKYTEELEQEEPRNYSSYADVDEMPIQEPVVLDYGTTIIPPPRKKKQQKIVVVEEKEEKEEKESDYLYEYIV
jgi:hypothetical protein